MRRRAHISLLFTLFILASAALTQVPVGAVTTACGTWENTHPPNPSSTRNELNAVTATSPTNAWAVGYFLNKQSVEGNLILRWDGDVWKKQPAAATGYPLRGVDATSATNAWAVGQQFDSEHSVHAPLILHWNGEKWEPQSAPSPTAGNTTLTGIAATSRSNAWAVGYTHDGQKFVTLILHWNGTSWEQQESPNVSQTGNVLYAVGATSASNAWAVGGYQEGNRVATLILHWDGSSWERQPSPTIGNSNNKLNGVAGLGGTAWAVGNYIDSEFHTRALTLMWNGTKWVRKPTQTLIGGLSAVAMTPSQTVAVGDYYDGSETRTLVMRWNGEKWQRQRTPNQGANFNTLLGVAAVSSHTFAVGYSTNEEDTIHKNVALHFC